MSIEWYAVHTLVGQEEKAKANLEKRIKAFLALDLATMSAKDVATAARLIHEAAAESEQ